MIALSFALPEESKGVAALLTGARREGSTALPRIFGMLGGREVAILHTGMGRVSAERELARFFAGHAPHLLVAAGFGGALDPTLRVGDVIVAENDSDPALRQALAARLPHFRTGILATVEAVVETAASKAGLARRTGAAFVDMETAEISRQCTRRGIPLLAVRAISDAAEDDLLMPVQVWFDAERQRPRPAALVCHLLMHPAKIAPFIRFVGGIGRAREALTRFLAAALPELPAA